MLSATGALTFGASVALKTVDENGVPLPCRYTIVHADTGSLALMKNKSDNVHAVRTGVSRVAIHQTIVAKTTAPVRLSSASAVIDPGRRIGPFGNDSYGKLSPQAEQ